MNFPWLFHLCNTFLIIICRCEGNQEGKEAYSNSTQQSHREESSICCEFPKNVFIILFLVNYFWTNQQVPHMYYYLNISIILYLEKLYKYLINQAGLIKFTGTFQVISSSCLVSWIQNRWMNEFFLLNTGIN